MEANGGVCEPLKSVAVLLNVAEGRQHSARLLPEEGAGLQLDHHAGRRLSRAQAVEFTQTTQTFVEDKG